MIQGEPRVFGLDGHLITCRTMFGSNPERTFSLAAARRGISNFRLGWNLFQKWRAEPVQSDVPDEPRRVDDQRTGDDTSDDLKRERRHFAVVSFFGGVHGELPTSPARSSLCAD